MRLPAAEPSQFSVGDAIRNDIQGDYIYMYPPRQAYRPMNSNQMADAIEESLGVTSDEPLNLYVHFPFCRQICKFCNLYSVVTDGDDDFYRLYVSAVIKEMSFWASRTQGRKIDTIYLGGGTPSLLAIDQLDAVLAAVESHWKTSRQEVSEVALEVAPDTVDGKRMRDLHSIGINRINIGLQSTHDNELRDIGRTHGFEVAKKTIEDSLSIGFSNVCVDLIYGLPNQTLDDWFLNVSEVIRMGPATICAYPLTVRPKTGFGRRCVSPDGSAQYAKYDLALFELEAAGYKQETHVRYIRDSSGGYRQKSNHWMGQDILGIGAGARGYLRTVDYRNRYSVLRRRDALTRYLADVDVLGIAFDSGMRLSVDEQARRMLILGLQALNIGQFEARFGAPRAAAYRQELLELLDLRLVEIDEGIIRLTASGQKYRDVAVLKFFSSSVWNLASAFDYHE